MNSLLLKIGEVITALVIIALVIALGIAGMTAAMKLIGLILGAH